MAVTHNALKLRCLSIAAGSATRALLGLLACACGALPNEAGLGRERAALEPGDASIDVSTTLQAISGFGASSAWTASNLPDALADELFSVEKGIGLSLLRVRIAPTGDTSEQATAQKAVARGARVWASPWSPPAAWKDSSTTNGGSLLPEHYQDWADELAGFAQSMSDAGTPLLMLSAQNEPNFTTDQWETCRWTADQLLTFVRDHLGPALAASGVATPVLGPETQDWRTLASFANPLLEDAAASSYLGAIATHGYGSSKAYAYAAPAENDKEFWVTELDDGQPDGTAFDPGMGSGLLVAKLLHDALTIANVNAWHYWWISGGSGPSNAAITDGTALTRRAYVMGNYSKFVRPGFVRVEATLSPQTNVLTSGFRDAAATRVVIVATNLGDADLAQHFVVSGGSLSEVVPSITSDTLALEQQDAVPLTDGAFDYVLPARSVTTFASGLSDVHAAGPGSDASSSLEKAPRSTDTGFSCSVGAKPSGGAGFASALALLGLGGATRRRRRPERA